jgi:hypothetical protein
MNQLSTTGFLYAIFAVILCYMVDQRRPAGILGRLLVFGVCALFVAGAFLMGFVRTQLQGS